MTTRIAHVHAPPSNVGDAAIVAAMRQRFADLSPVPLEWTSYDIQATTFDRAATERINATADLLIVGGGGLVMDRETNGPSGWQFDVRPDALEALEVPVTFYGIGWNEFPYGDDALRDHEARMRLAFGLFKAHGAADLFAYRNDGSAAEVANLFAQMSSNPVPPRFDVIPDPAFFLRPEPCEVPGLRPDAVKVGICWAGDRPERRWADGEGWGFAGAVMGGLADFAAGRDVQVLYLPHTVVDTGPWHPDLAVEALPDLLWPVSAPRYADIYRQLDVVLGMRKHSVILPLGQGTPTVSLGDQAEVLWTMQENGLGEWCVTSENVSAERVRTLLERALTGEQPKLDIEAMRADADAFDRRVLGLVAKGAAV